MSNHYFIHHDNERYQPIWNFYRDNLFWSYCPALPETSPNNSSIGGKKSCIFLHFLGLSFPKFTVVHMHFWCVASKLSLIGNPASMMLAWLTGGPYEALCAVFHTLLSAEVTQLSAAQTFLNPAFFTCQIWISHKRSQCSKCMCVLLAPASMLAY